MADVWLGAAITAARSTYGSTASLVILLI